MKAQHKTSQRINGGKSKSSKVKVHQSKANRDKHVRPLAPAQFVDIIEHINDGLVVLDKDWYYVYANQRAAVMLKRQKPSDLIGKHIWTEYPEGVGQPFHLAYEKAMKEQVSIVFEEHYSPWDLWFENRIYPSPDSLMILFTDITERKRMERLLEERQHLLQKILDTEPGTVYIYDLEERRNVYVNRYWLLAFGYTEEETQAMGDELSLRIFHPDDLARISAHHENWRQAGEGDIQEIEYRVRTKAGEWRWLQGREIAFARDDAGLVKQILGIAHDITEHKLAQEALRRSEQQLGLIYDSVSDILFLICVEPGDRYRFVSVNKAFLQATGLRSDQVIDRYADEIIPPSSQQLVFGNYKRAIQERVPVTWEEVSEYPAGKKTAIVTINAVYDEEGICTHLVGAVHDITERKRTEEELRKSEARYRAVVENQTEFIVRWKLDGTRTFVNEAYCRYFGITPEQALSASFIPLIAEEDRAAVEAKISRLISGEARAETDIHRVIKPDGSIGWQEWVDQAIYDEAGQLVEIQSVGRDVTERILVEKALRESEEKFSKVFYASPIPLNLNRMSDGRYVEVNESFLKRLGYQRDEVLGKTAWELGAWVHPEESEKMFNILREYGSLHNFEAQFRTKSGEIGTALLFREIVELAGEKYFIGTNLDITERKQTEEALATSEAEFRALFAAMDDVLFVIDREGVYRKVAPTNPRLLYKPREELLGMTVQDVFPAQQAQTFANTIRQVLESQQTTRIEYQLTIEGREIWFDASLSPIGAESILWMARDITDRKRAEESLRQLNEELEGRIAARTEELAAAMIRAQESDRLKSVFLATMSHELRTPLNSIIGFTGIILQGLAGPLNEEQTKQLNMTRDSARHLLALINDVLDISKIEAGQLEIIKRPFDMRQAVEGALRVVQPLAQKKNLELETYIGSGVGTINNDRRRVEQVLINLINNAIKFTQRGEVSIECQIRDGWLETSIRDDGIGIKPEDMERLFRPFQQIDTGLTRGHEGTGLGLAICKRLVVAMGGEIAVESQWGIGSTFKFRLPR
jgi:PAS domain S-box-containing protein